MNLPKWKLDSKMPSDRKHLNTKQQSLIKTLAALSAVWMLLTGLSVIPSAVGAADFASIQIETKLASLLPSNAVWDLVVVDQGSDKKLIRSGNANAEPLVPGSLVKLITTGALLDHEAKHGEPDLRTTLSHDGMVRGNELQGNLYLTGRGNAMLSADDLRIMASNLSRKGIVRIVGDIRVDTVLIDAHGMDRKRKGVAYAPVGALGLDLHTVAIAVYPSTTGKPPVIKVEPPNDAVRLAVEARTVGTDVGTLQVTKLDDLSYSVTGNIPMGAAPFRQRFLLQGPALYAGGTLRTLLRVRSIVVTGEVKIGQAPSNSIKLADIPSPDFDRLLRDMNVNSLNVVADNLLLLMGGEHFLPPGTCEKGLRTARVFIEKLGLSLDGMQIVDGSGLSEENRVTAEFMATYLQKVAQNPWFPQFYETLPRAGIDGTAREVGFADDRFRVKTGMLPDAFGLAGYGVDGSGRKIAFAFLVNHPGISGFDMKRAGAEVMKLLAKEVLQ